MPPDSRRQDIRSTFLKGFLSQEEDLQISITKASSFPAELYTCFLMDLQVLWLNFSRKSKLTCRSCRSDQTTIRIPLKKGSPDYGKGFKDISFSEFITPLSHKDRLKIALLIVSTRKNRPTGSTVKAWLRTQFKDEWLVRFADSFCGWSLSLKSDRVPVEELFEIIENMYRFGGHRRSDWRLQRQ